MAELNTTDSSLENESTEALLQRRDGLGKLLGNCAAAGVEPPSAQVSELEIVRAELARRNELQTELPRVKSWTDWLGTTIKSACPTMIDGLIGHGRYSFVFRATALTVDSAGQKKESVIKLARDPGDNSAGPFSTEALKIVPFQTGPISLLSDQMMQLQMERLRTISSANVVTVEDSGVAQNRSYYTMPLIDGVSLRKYLAEDGLTIQDKLIIFHAIARSISQSNLNQGKIDITDQPRLASALYHGDLTPDNIFVEWISTPVEIVDSAEQVDFSPTEVEPQEISVEKARITLIDPGYFGPLDCAEGSFETCMISTPSYYPLLEPDDLLAIGICMWEALTGRHPLAVKSDQTDTETVLEQDVIDLINFRNSLLQPYLTPLNHLQLPRQLNEYISEKIELLLIKALRLQLTANGKLTLAAGFADFGELESALAELL
jgi:serine/threonine protein kinase